MRPNPTSTYRLQLRPEFGFDHATELIPYLVEMGVSHLYASPYLQAALGSTHGYDVVDPSHVNRELGGADAHQRMCEAIKAAGLGQMIDIVPNHMAIAGRQNPWWWDVLENGPSSRYATFFDVDWDNSEERWPNKVLLPVLGDHYGRVLEAGELQLSQRAGYFILHYYEHEFPLDPSSLAGVLGKVADRCESELLAFLAESHARLPRPTVTARQEVERRDRDKAVLAKLLAKLLRDEPATTAEINQEIERINTDADALDALIDQQNYRVAYWRTASRDLGYRRFFDITDLAGLRVEHIEVFHATHALPIAWVRDGWVQGLRIDHPDGLRDPGEYFSRLRDACPDAWIVAEKILEPGETLMPDWPIAGTTGYDFLHVLGGLFIDSKNEGAHNQIYQEFTGEAVDFVELVRTSKRLVLTELLQSELNRITNLFVEICERHRRHRDYTSYELREALCETAVCYPVYRSYVSATKHQVGQNDRQYTEQAIECAMAERPGLDPELFNFLKGLLLLDVAGSQEGELAMRFQQLTGAAMAKGLEDTAFYRFHRLVALNEVGGDPSQFGTSLEHFHNACVTAQAHHPQALLASTTHDTKRSEDVRARLAVLSEIPERWAECVQRWADYNEPQKRCGFPDHNTEYLFYQTLVGAWPIDAERMTAYMEKACREAKVHTSWTRQDEVYESSVRRFVEAVMGDNEFIADVAGFVADIVTYGRLNSLAQTLIKLTAPGVPDVYQGTELWDLSLVDPDNRRPVDFAQRQQLAKKVADLTAEEVLAQMESGLPKLWLIRQVLRTRREHPELFGREGSYQPLPAQGAKANHLVAYMRGQGAVAVAPRLIMQLQDDWADTVLELPEGRWHNILTGDDLAGGAVRVQDLLARFPVVLLLQRGT